MKDETSDAKRRALEIMQKWDWISGDPDGNTWPHYMELREAVNRLAMHGQSGPHSAVLALLCQGDLTAIGDYKWQKYQWGKHYHLEKCSKEINDVQWKNLANSIEYERIQFESDEWPDKVDLDNLMLMQCPAYEWAFNDNRFTTATVPPDTRIHESSYFEEWFSAWNIEVTLKTVERLDFENDAEPAVESGGSKAPINSRTGRPAEYDWLEATNAIWAKLYGNELKPKSQADIERAMILHLTNGDDEPGQSTVRPYAKRVWEKFREN